MRHFSIATFTAVLLLIPVITLAQIQVSFPTSRAVFQRNSANQSTFRITGYYTTSITRVEARMTARDGQGTSTDWRTIQSNPVGGVYTGDFTALGGWYNLEVRGMNADQQVSISPVIERVGVGEVFVIAGQSNAQGIHQNAPDPQNDRVSCVNYRYPDQGFPNDPPIPVFTMLSNTPDFAIAPRGLGSWCWGQLGDLLVKRLNVPVMFFNAAFTGTSVRNWRDSAPEGGIARGYNDAPYPDRQPYINLKLALQFYCSTLGVRAVLWHQGEADNLLNTSTASYANDLKAVIGQSRQDFGKTVPWVVSRVSYGDRIGTSPAIIAGQNQVILTTPSVFEGPQTDNIQIPRSRPPLNDPEGFHFDFNGLVEVANAWNTSLDDRFFQIAAPTDPTPAPTVSVACAANNNLTFTVNGDYPTVQWDSGETGKNITKGGGALYRAKVKDALGNTFFTGQLRVSDAPVASIVDNRPASVCVGSSLNLTTNYDNVTWINQQNNATVGTTKVITTTTSGAFVVRYRDVSGCDFTSNAVTITVNPLPSTPVVANDKPTTFCQGDNTVLRVSNDNVTYNWSGGLQGKAVNVAASGAYFLTVTDRNGCTSAQSNTVVVVANPIPAKPTIAVNGPTTFCADRNVVLTAPQDVAYMWSTGQTTRVLTITQSNDFSVKTINQFGCSSEPSSTVRVTVNPLPPTPTVSASGTTTFCEGGRVTLNAASSFDVIWASGQTDKSIQATTSGNYAVQARDQNGCLSPYSSVIGVKVNPLPVAPTILASPSTVICEGDRATLRVDGPYTVFWSTGDSTKSITRTQAGPYTARVRDVNGCVSAQSQVITLDLKPLPPSPTINQIGTYTLQAVSSTNGTQFLWRRDNDSLAVKTAIIKANQTGTYTARSSIIYSSTLTCFSAPSAPVSYTIDLSNMGLSIYPNPNPDKILFLETQANLTNAVVTIYTMTGQLVMTTQVPAFDERKQLVLTSYPSGMYLLRVQAANFDVSKRILVGL